MANNIAHFQKYIAMLDEVYQLESLTSMLDGNNALVRMGANAGEFHVPKMSLSGLADYSRTEGYQTGSVTLDFETFKCNYDRGLTFNVDAMDNEESAGVAFGMLASEFIRTKVVPEIDTWRFAQYAAVDGATTGTGAVADASAILAELIKAQNALDEAQVPATQRYLYITPTLYNTVANADTNKSKAVLDSFAMTKKVPQARFKTEVTLGADGFTTGGSNINFMVIHKPAVLQYQKHIVSKVVTPEANQKMDAWMFFYRAYGLADTYENKRSGIYVHTAA